MWVIRPLWEIRVHEITYGFGGPSEKDVGPHYFSIGKYQDCVLGKIFQKIAGHVWQAWQISRTLGNWMKYFFFQNLDVSLNLNCACIIIHLFKLFCVDRKSKMATMTRHRTHMYINKITFFLRNYKLAWNQTALITRLHYILVIDHKVYDMFCSENALYLNCQEHFNTVCMAWYMEFIECLQVWKNSTLLSIYFQTLFV